MKGQMPQLSRDAPGTLTTSCAGLSGIRWMRSCLDRRLIYP